MRAGELLRELDSRVLPPLARGLHRLGADPRRVRLLTVVALVAVFAVLVTAVWVADRGNRTEPAVPELRRVGVVEGQSVLGYVRASDAELAALAAAPRTPAPVWALVTLAGYVAPERLAPLVDDAGVAEVYTRVPVAGVQSQVVRMNVARVPQDVVAGMLDMARRRDAEHADYRRLAGAVTGRDPADLRLRAAYEQASAAAAAEARAYRAVCSCVYAAVVRSTPAELTRLADRPEVRAVDPAPEVHDLGRTEFRPPLPEQAVVDAAVPPVERATPVPSLERATPVSPGEQDPAGTGPPGPSPESSSAPRDPTQSDEPQTPSAGATGAPRPEQFGLTAIDSVTPSSSAGALHPLRSGVPSSEPSRPVAAAQP